MRDRVRVAPLVLAVVAAACGGATSPDSTTSSPARATPTPGEEVPVDGGDAMPDRPLDLGDAAAIAPLDPATLVVGADTIVFDTFDGGSVTLAAATPDRIRGLLDAIPPIDAPAYESAEQAIWLVPEDVVIGYIDDTGNAWAYPVRILNFHEIVNDQFAGIPVLVSYCPLCGSGVVFDRRLDDRTLSFSNTSALHESDLVMVDRQTGSYWWQVPGRSLGGPLAGQELAVLPSRTVTWDTWLQEHPDTQVLARPGRRPYDRDPFVSYAELVDGGRTSFPVSDSTLADDRLSPATAVLVATIDGMTRAWPVEPARTVGDRIADTEVTVMVDGVGGTVVDAAGDQLPTRRSFWFAIVASFPDVTTGP